MRIFLLIKIIFCGLFLFGLASAFIYACFKSESFLACIAAIFLIILVGYLPACFFYYDVIKYNSQPEPTNKIEKCIDGIIYIQYQDINHFCHYGENATVFTSLMPLDGKASQTDTCIMCHKPFLRHDTKDEQDFFQSIIEANEGACLMVNHAKNIEAGNPLRGDVMQRVLKQDFSPWRHPRSSFHHCASLNSNRVVDLLSVQCVVHRANNF